MRKFLLLALLLYNVVAFASRPGNYDYEDMDGNKRHSLIDDRRNWRKKTLLKSEDHKDWNGRPRHDYDNPRYLDEDPKAFNVLDRQRDQDLSVYRGPRHYEQDMEKLITPSSIKSSELAHSSALIDKDPEKKPVALNCERPHEKYEACFSGCASVSCDNPRDRLRPCYPFCEPGCICIHPYVRDDRTHKCVLPEDCTKGLKGIPDLGEDI